MKRDVGESPCPMREKGCRVYALFRNLAIALIAVIAQVCLFGGLAYVGRTPYLPSVVLVQPLIAVVLALMWPCRRSGAIAAWRKWVVGLLAPFSLLLLAVSVVFMANVIGVVGVILDLKFRHAVKDADRVVVRDGGFNCCQKNVDDQPILCEITNRAEVAAFGKQIRFSGIGFKCCCCGHPGIDWWQGDRKIALTAMHHGRALRWSGFSMGDAQLTTASRQKLKEWLDARIGKNAKSDLE